MGEEVSLNPEYQVDPSKFSAITYVVDSLERSNTARQADAKRVSELFRGGVSASEKQQYVSDLDKVNNEVKRIVDENYDGFNSSVSGFSNIFQEFTEAQTKVRKLKEYVHRSKETLLSRKRNLKSLWFQKMQHIKVLQLLAEIQEVKTAPRTIERLLEEEKFVECVDHFQKAYTTSFSGELASIGALSEVRELLVSYRERMHETLIEALIGYLSGSNNRHNSGLKKDNIDEIIAKLDPQATQSTHLSSSAVLSLDSIVVALNKLGRLPAALHAVKSNLREQLNTVIDTHMKKAQGFRQPVGLAMSQDEIDDVRLEIMFRNILSNFQAIFTRHVQFSMILKSESKELAQRDYSILETWSTVQVEVQQLLELHLTVSTSDLKAFSSPVEVDASVNFTFSSARLETLERTRNSHRDAFAVRERTPICRPSPYRILALIQHLVPFAEYGDESSGLKSRPQLLGYVREFCSNTLLPQVEEDGVKALFAASEGEFALHKVPGGVASGSDAVVRCCTNIGTALCKQIYQVASVAPPLELLGCEINSVLAAFLAQFVEFAENTMKQTCVNKLCTTFREKLSRLLKEDPNYLGIVSLDQHEFENLDKFRQVCLEFTQNERALEKELLTQLPQLQDPTVEIQDRLLSSSQLAKLAALHSTCDLLFRTLAFESLQEQQQQQTSSSNNVSTMLHTLSADLNAQDDMSPQFKLLVSDGPLAIALSTPKLQRLLARLDQIAEQSLFTLRSELRVRCLVGLRKLPHELSQEFQMPSSASSIAQDLVKCTRSVDPNLTPEHASYLVRSLCSLLAESMIRSLVEFASLSASSGGESKKKRSSSKKQQQQPHQGGFIKLSKTQVRLFQQSLVILQQTMWTILLNSHEEIATSSETKLNSFFWQVARDQLTAFDGARRFFQFLQSSQERDPNSSLREISQTLLGGISAQELESVVHLFTSRPKQQT